MKISDDGCPQLNTLETYVRIDWANEEIRRWWESQPMVFGSDNEPLSGWSEVGNERTTHQAHLCGIMPIKNDTAEDIVRDLLEWKKPGSKFELDEILERARKVLERGE